MTPLPSTWARTTLGEVSEWSSGGTPSRSNGSNYGGGIPWAVIGDLNDGIVSQTHETITHEGLRNSSAKWIEEGSVLLAMYGSIGKLGIAARRLTSNQAIAFARPHPGISNRYLFYYLMSQRAVLVSAGKGGTQSNISQTVIKAFDFVCAPSGEQKRIVEALDSYLPRLDSALESFASVRAKLKAYRASVLKAAVEGRLVPTEAELARGENREYEPADVLLKRILAERRHQWEQSELAKLKAIGKVPNAGKWKTVYEEPLGPDVTGLPRLPEGWCWARAEQLTQIITKGASPEWQGFGYVESGGVPFLRSQNVRWGALDLNDLARVEERFSQKEAKSILRSGDVLLNIVGASIGRAAVATAVLEGANTNQAVAIMRPVSGVRPEWLTTVLLSPRVQANIHASKVDVARANLSLGDIADLVVPIPPMAEQERITAELERQFSVGATAEAELERSIRRSFRLRQSILKYAFDGKLVDHDPNDQPASLLLERIRDERANSNLDKRRVPKVKGIR